MSKRRKFSSQFKQGAVEQVQQPGINCAQVARELGNGANLLTRWRREAEAEAPAFVVEAADWSSAASRSFAIEGAGAESALGNRLVPRLGRPGRLGELGGGHRLPHTRAAGLASVTHGPCNDGQCCPGASADRSVRDPGARSGAVSTAIRQWLGLHESALHGAGSQLRSEAGIHHAALPTAERHGGACDPIAEGAMRAPASLRNPAACQPTDQ
ncbi:Transposase [Hydrocarboniphaga daqingensis]|uniref:Transposase n=1 Tax=Hydrocarboniphaga daqingensis TaxID=490188 RepID=A0A1M5JRL6_9GAMM|nr:Transposase [Hydrocarboniphaga daqingensis]